MIIVCSACRTPKIDTEFYNNSSTRTGRMNECKKCFDEAQERYNKKLAKENPRHSWATKVRGRKSIGRKLNFSVADLTQLANESDVCAACEKELVYMSENGFVSPQHASLITLTDNIEVSITDVKIICFQCSHNKKIAMEKIKSLPL